MIENEVTLTKAPWINRVKWALEFIGASPFLLVMEIKIGCLLELMRPYLIEALKSALMRLCGKQEQMGIGGIFKNHEGDASKAFLKPTGVK